MIWNVMCEYIQTVAAVICWMLALYIYIYFNYTTDFIFQQIWKRNLEVSTLAKGGAIGPPLPVIDVSF